jgi:hypothetical protein
MKRFLRDQGGMMATEAFVIFIFLMAAGAGAYWFVFSFSKDSAIVHTVVALWEMIRSIATGEAAENAVSTFEMVKDDTN